MRKHLLSLMILATLVISASVVCNGQSNLLQNGNADLKADSWRVYGQATVEGCQDDPCFVVRNGGYFVQDVTLPAGAIGKYALFIGRGASERINADGAITGLPYLYGYMMPEASERGGRILDYLQGQNMRASPTRENEWVTMWGIFRVPEGTGAIRFFLNQALRNGVPHNGSAARFDDVGLYLFATEQEARAFANARH
jgi:hypothetical protein